MSCTVVQTTCGTLEKAQVLAEKIVTSKLAACVHIIPNIQSVYIWEGNLQKDTEHVLVGKTKTEKVDSLIEFIKENHSYDTPEVITFEITGGSPEYLKWVRKSTIS